jgi:hypothetical protein
MSEPVTISIVYAGKRINAGRASRSTKLIRAWQFPDGTIRFFEGLKAAAIGGAYIVQQDPDSGSVYPASLEYADAGGADEETRREWAMQDEVAVAMFNRSRAELSAAKRADVIEPACADLNAMYRRLRTFSERRAFMDLVTEAVTR